MASPACALPVCTAPRASALPPQARLPGRVARALEQRSVRIQKHEHRVRSKRTCRRACPPAGTFATARWRRQSGGSKTSASPGAPRPPLRRAEGGEGEEVAERYARNLPLFLCVLYDPQLLPFVCLFIL